MKGDSKEAQTADKDCLVHLCKLLAPFVEENDTLQAEVLFEAQKLCEETGHISGAWRVDSRSRPVRTVLL